MYDDDYAEENLTLKFSYGTYVGTVKTIDSSEVPHGNGEIYSLSRVIFTHILCCVDCK